MKTVIDILNYSHTVMGVVFASIIAYRMLSDAIDKSDDKSDDE